MIDVQELSVGYRIDEPIIEKINFNIEKGNFCGLVAKNGTGKSTLIKSLSGALTPLKGDYFLSGNSVKNYQKKEFSKKIALVLTEKPFLSGYTVWDLVSMGRFPYTEWHGQLNKKDREVISESIKCCKIEHLSSKFCTDLSDGEFQKAMLARALAQETDVLLLDEPTAFLDYSSKRNLMQMLREITKNQLKTVIIASHDLELILQFTDQILLLKSKTEHVILKTSEISLAELIHQIET